MDCRQSKIFSNGSDNGSSGCLIGLGRKDLVMVSILGGHCLLNDHLSMIGQKAESRLDGCELEETGDFCGPL